MRWRTRFLDPHLTARRPRAADLPQVLALLEALRESVAAGEDFFAALAAATDELPPGRVRRAARECVARFDERRPLKRCLRALHAGHPLLGELAADVRRAGWEAGRPLRIVVRLVEARAVRAWAAGRRRRALADRLDGRLRLAGAAALGLAVMTAFSGHADRLPAVPAAVQAAPPPSTAPPSTPADLRSRHLPMPPEDPRDAIRAGGWLPLDDLPPDAGGRTAAAEVPTCRITTGYAEGVVRIRTAPGMDGRVAGYAAEGEAFDWLGEASGPGGGGPEGNGWRRVRLGALEGWVYAPLCAAP